MDALWGSASSELAGTIERTPGKLPLLILPTFPFQNIHLVGYLKQREMESLASVIPFLEMQFYFSIVLRVVLSYFCMCMFSKSFKKTNRAMSISLLSNNVFFPPTYLLAVL